MKKLKISRSAAPSVFTSLNMVFGFLCIIFAAKGEFITAAFCIIFGAICDSLDGIVARFTKSSSKFGVELDSLADVITFGVAPSALLYFVYFNTLGTWGIILSMLPMIFGAMRLARFNVQLVGFDKEYFHGIPIPSQAMTICSYIIFFYDSTGLNSIQKDVLIPLTICMSILMVTTIKYDTLPKFNKKDIKRKPIRFAIFIIGIILMIYTQGKAIFPFFIFYTLFGLIRATVKVISQVIRHLKHEDKKVELLEK
jgi:CDP-diacylglycerol---serine O-phosphatidyltransferase